MKKRFETLKKAFLRARTARSHKQAEPVDDGRRKFLKLLALGGGTFFAAKFFGTFSDYLSSDPAKVLYFKNFKITESRKELGVYDSGGNEILVIDKEE